MVNLVFKRLLVYSTIQSKGFYSEFSDSVNIIHGRNTSGKSTLIQSLIYALGINDSKENLNDINDDDVFFRLDCTLKKDEKDINLVFVRSSEMIVIKEGSKPPIRFDGINSNNSKEYKKYKEYFSKLINFTLLLQYKSELTSAPLEAALLPYYVSQSVGWVSIRESIGNFRFYKDFKLDYLDYYCGIENSQDRINKYNLEKEKKELEFEFKILSSYEDEKEELQLSKLLDNKLKGEINSYLNKFQELNTELSKKEAEHTQLCNKLSMLRGRQKVLNHILKNTKHQKPKIDNCPVCQQTLLGNLKDTYIYNQDINNTQKELKDTKNKIKSIISKLNSAEDFISKHRTIIEKKYSILKNSNNWDATFDSWLEHHAYLKMAQNIQEQKYSCSKKIYEIKASLEKFKSDHDINSEREKKEKEFLSIFRQKVSALGAKLPKEFKYRDLYSLTVFPNQGVELHKLLMAYNFSFYEMIKKDSNIHSFPFLLDAIFKEDIDLESRATILKFLSKEAPLGGQIFFSTAEYKNSEDDTSSALFKPKLIKNNYFSPDTKLICIGDGKTERTFLSGLSLYNDDIIEETIDLLSTI